MKNFVFFDDKKLFEPSKIWRIEEIIRRFPKTKIYMIGGIEVKASNGKTLQTGLVIESKNEIEAVDLYENIKDILNVGNK